MVITLSQSVSCCRGAFLVSVTAYVLSSLIGAENCSLTYWGLNKMTFCRKHFRVHYIKWKEIDQNWIELFHKGLIDNKSALVRLCGAKPLPEQMEFCRARWRYKATTLSSLVIQSWAVSLWLCTMDYHYLFGTKTLSTSLWLIANALLHITFHVMYMKWIHSTNAFWGWWLNSLRERTQKSWNNHKTKHNNTEIYVT